MPCADTPRAARRTTAALVLAGALLAIVAPATLVLVVASAAPAAAQALPDLPGLGAEPGPAPAPAAAAPAPAPADGAVPAVPAVPGVPTPEPGFSVNVSSGDEALSRTVVLVLLLTVGSVAPGLLLLMTTFTRFIVVLGLAKNALALQTVPPAQVLVGLALFLTFFVMNPVLTEVNEEAIQPLLAGSISQSDALEAGFEPIRAFMLAQTRDEDLTLFVDLADGPRPANLRDVSAATLIPAFAISELRTAFLIGFIVFIPFLVIDLVVAAVLMSMGMVMLPPVFISLPLKLLLFVLVDGWVLIVGSMVGSVQGVVL